MTVAGFVIWSEDEPSAATFALELSEPVADCDYCEVVVSEGRNGQRQGPLGGILLEEEVPKPS